MWQNLLIKLLTAIIFPLLDKLWDWADKAISDYKAKKEAEQKAKEAKEKMDAAKTAEEIDNAADDTLNGI